MRYIERCSYFIRGLSKLVWACLFERRPFILSHLITSRCNCRCGICLWRDWDLDELCTGEILRIYKDARKNGFVAVAIWGGEPLLRGDIIEILAGAKALGFVTIIVTNGFYLPELAKELVPYLNALTVSLDFPNTKHDEFRQCNGLFERAVSGIIEAKEACYNTKIAINCTLSKINVSEVEGMIRLAERLGVSITFSIANLRGCEAEDMHEKYQLSMTELNSAFKKIKKYKVAGYKINNSDAYIKWVLEGNGIYRCHTLDTVLTVQPDGKVRVCLSGKPIGDLKELSVEDLLKMEIYRSYQALSHECHNCMDFGTVECAHLWTFKPRAIAGMLHAFLT